MKWKRSARKKITLISGFFIFLLCAFLIVKSNIFVIKSINVFRMNVDCADEGKLGDSSEIFGKNLFLIDQIHIQNKLKKDFYCIKNINISRIFPSKIKLSVFGREPAIIAAVLKDKEATQSAILEEFSQLTASSSAEVSSDQFVIDKEGVVYSSNIEHINAPTIYVSGFDISLGQKIDEQLIIDILKVLENLKTFGVDVKEVKIYSQIALLINGTPKIIFKLDKIDKQIASLQLILEKAKMDSKVVEFSDLRFDKPVVKFAPKKK